MSISEESAKEHINDPAVLCCRAEKGITLSSHNLEDPAIFDDLVDSGLLNLDGCLKIGQVLGAILTKTCDSLTPLTPDVIDHIMESEEISDCQEAAAAESEAPAVFGCAGPASAIPGQTIPVAASGSGQPAPALQMAQRIPGGVLKISIGEGKNIHIELPMGGIDPMGNISPLPLSPSCSGADNGSNALPGSSEKENDKEETDPDPRLIRSLTRHHYRITEVKRGPETRIDGTILYIREGIEQEAIDSQELVHDLKIDIIAPDNYHTYSETIMDVQPIAVKDGESEIGSGITRVLDGVIMMVTGTDDNGVQIGEFGSSEGILDENIMWNRPGAPDKGEIFIKTQVTIKAGTNMERPGPLAAHSATDVITHEIRQALKALEDDSLIVNKETFNQYRRPGKKKVVIVKEIMGQGAMHDNLLLPVEPVGVLGARPNVDLGNVPVMVSPLEVLDGCIHALTCIGPASKEMSRHYWREPLVLETLFDPELDLCGVLLVGSPQINAEKFYVSKRVGMTCEALDVDGAFVTTEGFGNNHIDFASHIEQIGMRGIAVVGLSFCANQGALVVGNKYMTHMVDNNKSEAGIENEVLANNTLCHEDAIRAIYMLKAQMNGTKVKAPERKWNPHVKENNMELISNVTGKPITPVLNETSLPMSKKRREKYS